MKIIFDSEDLDEWYHQITNSFLAFVNKPEPLKKENTHETNLFI